MDDMIKRPVRVTLLDGTKIEGLVTGRTEQGFSVQTSEGATRRIRKEEVVMIEENIDEAEESKKIETAKKAAADLPRFLSGMF